ncbi:MAG: PhzF family phenazine biosynthesis protein, partial [Stackebrandtia sp.]
ESVSRVYVYSFDPASRVAHSRLFADELGVVEDPATGSAALGLGVQLVAEGLLPADGTTSYVVNQGAEMGRPSLLECEVDAEAGRAHRVRVRGQVVPIAKGEFVAMP